MASRAVQFLRRSPCAAASCRRVAGPATYHACHTSSATLASVVSPAFGFHTLPPRRSEVLGRRRSSPGQRQPRHQHLQVHPPSPLAQQRRTLFIQTEDTPNPNSIKFHPGRVVLPEEYGTGFFCTKGDVELRRSPLARKIFAEMEDITGVFLGRDFITLTKEEDHTWKILRPMALSVIMDFFAEGKPVVTEAPVASDTAAHEDDDEVVAMIKELIEERIRPSVQDDGGDIFYRGFDKELGLVKLELAGSCKGCPSSSVTLKQGVEAMLMHYVPEVQGIQEIVDNELVDLNKKEADTLEQKLAKAGIPFSD